VDVSKIGCVWGSGLVSSFCNGGSDEGAAGDEEGESRGGIHGVSVAGKEVYLCYDIRLILLRQRPSSKT